MSKADLASLVLAAAFAGCGSGSKGTVTGSGGSSGGAGVAGRGGAGAGGADAGGAAGAGNGGGGTGQAGLGGAGGSVVGGAGGPAGSGGAAAADGGAAGASAADGGTDASSDASSDGSCTTRFTVEAKQTPGAIMLVVDRSAKLTGAPWSALSVGIVAALDSSAFDDLAVGLLAYPQTFTDPPSCLCDSAGLDPATCKSLFFPGLACGTSGSPDVAIANAVRVRSTSAGVRRDILQLLSSRSPPSSTDDGSPGYAAMAAGYNALATASQQRRALVLLSGGGFNCAAVANPVRPGLSDGTCNDWEFPALVGSLISQHQMDPTTPTETFVVGLPGTHSAGAMEGMFATAPYSLALALSTYAVAGSPASVDPACSKSAMFTIAGAPPAAPCHVDLGADTSFDSGKIASALRLARQRAFGCVYDVPTLPQGATFDVSKTLVSLTIGTTSASVRRRRSSSDACVSDGCWDTDASGHVTLLGAACQSFIAATDATVTLAGGCP